MTSYFPPDSHSGIGRYTEDLSLGFVNNGHDVEVIVVGKILYTETSRNGFRVHWLLSVSKWLPSSLPFLHLLMGSYHCRKKLIDLHKTKPFDVIEFPNTGIVGLMSLLLNLPEPRPKFIVRLVSPRSIFKKNFNFYRITEFLESLQARCSDAILAVSQRNYTVCQKSYQFSTAKPHRIILLGLPHGVEAYLAEPLSKSDSLLRVFFLGRMEDRKGFDVLAKAWPKVVAAVPQVKLVVAGEDLPHNGEASFYAWATRNVPVEVRSHIKYLGEVNDELRDLLYKQCDICVIPSRYESFGLISLEAMRYGKPLVSSNVGGIPEVITDGVTGFLVPVEDHDALANAIINLLQDESMREQFGHNALADVKARFSPERVVYETECFYRSLLG